MTLKARFAPETAIVKSTVYIKKTGFCQRINFMSHHKQAPGNWKQVPEIMWAACPLGV
jgi:hypothetical protein